MGAEPYTEETRRRIEALFDMKVYNSYGLSEMNGPGVAFECQYQNGLHLWEDAYLMEIIDPNTGKLVPDGEVGELVLKMCIRDRGWFIAKNTLPDALLLACSTIIMLYPALLTGFFLPHDQRYWGYLIGIGIMGLLAYMQHARTTQTTEAAA